MSWISSSISYHSHYLALEINVCSKFLWSIQNKSIIWKSQTLLMISQTMILDKDKINLLRPIKRIKLNILKSIYRIKILKLTKINVRMNHLSKKSQKHSQIRLTVRLLPLSLSQWRRHKSSSFLWKIIKWIRTKSNMKLMWFHSEYQLWVSVPNLMKPITLWIIINRDFSY